MAEAPQQPELGKPGSRRCPECLVAVEPNPAAGNRNIFCCKEHSQTHRQRQLVRGRRLSALAMAARITRNGTRRNKGAGKSARRDHEKLIDKFIVEDRKAGRMPADEYFSLRWKLNLDADI